MSSARDEMQIATLVDDLRTSMRQLQSELAELRHVDQERARHAWRDKAMTRRPRAVALAIATVTAVVSAAMFGVAPAMADRTTDDLQCPTNHCVNAVDMAHGDLNNLAEDAGFERSPAALLPNSPSWASSGAPQTMVVNGGSNSLGMPNCYTGVRCASRLGTGTSTSGTLTNAATAEARPGDTFLAEGWLRGDGYATGTGGLQLTWYGAAPPGVRPSVLRVDRVALPPSSSYRLVRVKGSAPAGSATVGAAFVVLDQTAGTWWADAMRFERVTHLDELNIPLGFGLSQLSTAYGTFLQVNPATVQQRVTTSCPAGTAMVAIAQNGAATCRAGDGFAYYAYRNSTHEICNTFCDEATMTLPAGTWAVFAKEQIYAYERPVICKLTLGADSDAVWIRGGLSTPASLQLVATNSTPSSVELACGDSDGASEGEDIKITAIPLGGQNRTALQ